MLPLFLNLDSLYHWPSLRLTFRHSLSLDQWPSHHLNPNLVVQKGLLTLQSHHIPNLPNLPNLSSPMVQP